MPDGAAQVQSASSTAERRISLAAYYNAVYKPRGFALAPHHYPLVMGLEDRRIRQLLYMASAGTGKALAADTPILTARGWLTIDEVHPGDQVVHPSGYFTRVLARQDTPSQFLYRLTFSDGRSVVAHPNHLWKVHHQKLGLVSVERARTEDGRRRREITRAVPVEDAWAIMSTTMISCRTSVKSSPRFFVPLTDPIELPEIPVWSGDTSTGKGKRDGREPLPDYDPDRQLAMPPYLLGCILGDGYVNNSGISLVSTDDEEMGHLMAADAAIVGMSTQLSGTTAKIHCTTWRINGAARRMRALGLAGKKADEKFVPSRYFTASTAQRLALLQGLMDTDGTADRKSGTASFTSVSPALATSVRHLARSLGAIAKMTVLTKTYPHHGELRIGKPAYHVSIRMRDPSVLFRLTRKRAIARPTQYSKTLKLRIANIESVEPARSVCIQVEAEDGLFLADDCIVTHNSNLLDIAYASWELGHDPELTIQALSAGEALPQGFMSSVMQIIQHDKTFRETFPEVRPAPDLGWSVSRGLFVTGHPPSDPDASYKAYGIASKALTGGHCRLQILDDLHDRENASTPESRQIVKNTYYDTIMGRADPRGCRRVAAGRWWAPDDIYQEWISSGDWVVLSLPAVRPGNTRLWYDVYVPKDLTCVYTEMLDPDRDQDDGSPYVRYRAYYGAMDPTKKGFYWPASPSKRQEYESVARRQPRTAAINYRGDMTGGGEGIFDRDSFRLFGAPEGLSDGIQNANVRTWVDAMKGFVEDAWDTALGQPQSSSMTAALTGLLVPCSSWHRGEDEALIGKCDFHYDVYLLDLMVKHLRFDELARELRIRHGLWHPRRVNVEEKSSGVSLIQTFRGGSIPVHGLKVPQGKVERAVNPVLAGSDSGKPIAGGAASVQGWWGMGRVLGPAGADWLERGPDGTKETGFLSRVCAFTGGSKAADEFDALVHLVTRAIVLSRKQGRFGAMPTGGPSDEDVAIANDDDPRRLALQSFGTLADPTLAGENPLAGMCIAPCGHYGIISNREWCGLHGRATNSLGGCTQWAPRKAG